MAMLLRPLLFVFFARGVIAQFLNPPNSNSTGGVSGLQLTEGSSVVVSWDLPSDATQADSKLYLWLDPGDSGEILTSNTTLDHFTWTVSAYGINTSDASTFHLTLYAAGKEAVAGQGYFSTEVFAIVEAPASSLSSSTSIPTSSPIASSTTSTSPAIATTTLTPSQTGAATHTGLATSTKIGLGVGIGLGVVVLAAIGFIFGKRYQKSVATKARTAARTDVPYTQYYDRAELPGPQHKLQTVEHRPLVELPANQSLLVTPELSDS